MIINMPNVQPYFSFSKKGFELGSWGSAAVNGDFSELDIYAAYSLSNFKFSLTDYYTFSDSSALLIVLWRSSRVYPRLNDVVGQGRINRLQNVYISINSI